MAMSARTARFAQVARDFFGKRRFTDEELQALSQERHGCALSTLVRHGIVCEATPRYRTVETYAPQEFVDYVNDLVGDDLWGWQAHFTWDPQEQVFHENEPISPYYVICG